MNTHQQTAAQEAQAELQAEWEREGETSDAPSETPSVSIWRITNSGDVVPFDASDTTDEYDETSPPKEQEIEVVVYRPNEWPRVRKIENTLAALQQLVGGRIEVFRSVFAARLAFATRNLSPKACHPTATFPRRAA